MVFEKQKPVSDEYREKWQEVFDGVTSLGALIHRPTEVMAESGSQYPNGCPILSEEPHGS